MKPIILPNNLSLSKILLTRVFLKHEPHSLFIDCNGKPALKELHSMKYLENAKTIFLHNYPASEITDRVLSQLQDKQLVFATLKRATPAKVIEFNLPEYPKPGATPSHAIVNILSTKLTAVMNRNFIPQLEAKYAKILQYYYDGIIGKSDLKLKTYYKTSPYENKLQPAV